MEKIFHIFLKKKMIVMTINLFSFILFIPMNASYSLSNNDCIDVDNVLSGEKIEKTNVCDPILRVQIDFLNGKSSVEYENVEEKYYYYIYSRIYLTEKRFFSSLIEDVSNLSKDNALRFIDLTTYLIDGCFKDFVIRCKFYLVNSIYMKEEITNKPFFNKISEGIKSDLKIPDIYENKIYVSCFVRNDIPLVDIDKIIKSKVFLSCLENNGVYNE